MGRIIPMFRAWTEMMGLEAGERYLIINPFFPQLRIQGRLGRGADRGRNHHPNGKLRYSGGDRAD